MPAESELLERVQAARELVESRKTARIQAAARYEQLKNEVETFKHKLSEQGIDPTRLDDMIAEAQAKLEASLTQLEKSLNGAEEST